MKLSIIIPCFNEKSTINEIIDRVLNFSSYQKEIIVIDDYSTDGTRDILKSIEKSKIQKLILNEKNYGKGYSLRKGIREASGDILIIQDADLEYDPNDYDKMINPIKNGIADVVYGSRFIGSNEKGFYFIGIV